MELEYRILPNKPFLIDNIPAGKAGEWLGHRPNRWKGSKLIIHPYHKIQIFDDGNYVIPKNRKHFPEKFGKEIPLKPAKRLFTAKPDFLYIEKPNGIRKINYQPSIEKTEREKRHFKEKFKLTPLPKLDFIGGLKTFYKKSNTESNLNTYLEKEMGEKKRILSLIEQRNGLLMKNPGDKFYSNVEQFPTYYKDGGFIPGSTNNNFRPRTCSRQSEDFYDTLLFNKKMLKPNKIYKNKLKLEILDKDKKYVENIKGWERNILTDYDPVYVKTKKELMEEQNEKKNKGIKKAKINKKKSKGKNK